MLVLYTTPQSIIITVIIIGAPVCDSHCISEHGGVDWCGGLVWWFLLWGTWETPHTSRPANGLSIRCIRAKVTLRYL